MSESKMKRKKVAVLMTCYNRAEATVKCIRSLYDNNKNIDFRFVVTDDNSSDDTRERLSELPCKIRMLSGNGNLFWNGGMRMSMSFALEYVDRLDYVLLVNDDVDFFNESIEKLIQRIEDTNADVVVGATCDPNGRMSYGGVKKTSKFFAKFDLMNPLETASEQCDTFNCNCVLMKADAFKTAGNLDSKYTHSMGDYDYGMTIRRLGMTVLSSLDYVGQCSDNDVKGSWRDSSLPRFKRLKLKEGAKGLPFSDWFHFVNKNYGFPSAVYHSVTPYIRILIGK